MASYTIAFGLLVILALTSLVSAKPVELMKADLVNFDETAVALEDVETYQGALDGFFITECVNQGTYNGQPLSYFQTRFYNKDENSYQIDTTRYIGDPKCTPALSDVYYKSVFKGIFTPKGPNTILGDGVQKASLTWVAANVTLANSSQYDQVYANKLNKQCPCGGVWAPGETRRINATECKGTVDPTADRLCQIVTGGTDYYSYKWTDDAGTKYITSTDCFSDTTECWNRPLLTSFERERLSESGNRDPSDCDYIRWANYKAPITRAYRDCRSCESLECDGCLFRELNPDWDTFNDTQKDLTTWHDACPCIYYFAETFDSDWVKTYC
eukprot:TRINITY_DN12069_c2_g1_i1.p1 TRINITY_DN12069_c2_g1~~TRINITY_DN12069_c2_g1_i1.p1  ORF type:complete len:328 (+),score=66.67 TRINITY_DN12069_c2_g1_i1:53-1036(+)